MQELEINRSLHINNKRKLEDPIDDIIDRFKNHPSINRIYQNGFTSNSFHFRKIVIDDVYEVLKSLNPSKAFQNDNIPPSYLRDNADVCAGVICNDVNRSIKKDAFLQI